MTGRASSRRPARSCLPSPVGLLLVVLLCLAVLTTAAVAVHAADPDEAALLDVDVPLFDPNLPASRAVMRERGIYPEIRRVESRYFAVAIARELAATGRWGDVRVVPAADETADLTVSGTIVRSDGRYLELAIRAVDARGDTWLANNYAIRTPVPLEAGAIDAARRAPDLLAPLYQRVASDLGEALAARSPAERRRIREIGLLRYGRTLAPAAFADYLVREPAPARPVAAAAGGPDGGAPAGAAGGVADRAEGGAVAAARDGDEAQTGPAATATAADGAAQDTATPAAPPPTVVYRAVRLPASDDPMLARIERVRLTERQLKDTAHRLYARTFDDIREGYETWRRYSAQQLAYVEDRERRLGNRDGRRRRRDAHTYAAYKQSYENYRWARLQEQRLEEWAARLDTEVSPTVKEVEGTLVELEGSLEEQYAEWRRILQRLFELETGGAARDS